MIPIFILVTLTALSAKAGPIDTDYLQEENEDTNSTKVDYLPEEGEDTNSTKVDNLPEENEDTNLTEEDYLLEENEDTNINENDVDYLLEEGEDTDINEVDYLSEFDVSPRKLFGQPRFRAPNACFKRGLALTKVITKCDKGTPVDRIHHKYNTCTCPGNS